jgi:hypothetical protein
VSNFLNQWHKDHRATQPSIETRIETKMPRTKRYECLMCLDRNSEGDLQPLGCGCVGEGAHGHLKCSLAAAERMASNVGYCFWFKCSHCMQEYTGVTRMTLAKRWCELVNDRAEEDDERLEAAHNLASCFVEGGQQAEAEKMQRETLAV